MNCQGSVPRRLPGRVGLPLVAGIVIGLVVGLAGVAPRAHAAPIRYPACGFSGVDGWPVSGVSVRNVSCAQAKCLLDRFARTGQGLGCDLVAERGRLRIRCYARVPTTGSGSVHRRYVEALIVIADLIAPTDQDCGV